MQADIDKLIDQMPGHVMAKDLNRLQNQLKRSRKNPKQLSQALAALTTAQQIVETRLGNMPLVDLAADLPISQQADKITDAIQNNQVTIIAGETGTLCGCDRDL